MTMRQHRRARRIALMREVEAAGWMTVAWLLAVAVALFIAVTVLVLSGTLTIRI